MFVSINEPEHFSWHDAEIKRISCQNQDMLWTVELLNVLTSNSQHSGDIDLCASTAMVIFENYSIESVKRYGFKSYQGGILIEEQPDKMLSRQEISALLKEMIHDIDNQYISYIYWLDSSTDGKKIHLSIDVDDVCIEITCDKFIVKWDGFEGKAWYWDRANRS